MMIIKSMCSSVVPSAERQPANSILTENAELTVRVCLRRVFGSRRARCVLRAERERPASWLAQRVQALFPAAGTGETVLVSAGYVLPPDEPLAVLGSGDLVEIIPLHKDYGDEDERKFYEKFTSALTEDLTFQQDQGRIENGHSDETPIDPDSHPECGATHPDPHLDPTEDLLHEMKRRALLLLDEYSETPLPYPIVEVEEKTKRRRRRVRRRRAPCSPFPIVGAGCESPSGAVERNAGAAARAPRCVRAGSPTCDTNKP